ncbi:MAG: SIMPL domain-containing protein [Paludibacter sp.]|nr:SIMPL domain-containing protein [Paludibacter sp.]
MKNTFLVIISILCVLFAGCKNEHRSFKSYVEVAGYAEQEVSPDIFYLNFTLSENNSQKININVLEGKIVNALKLLNIDTQEDLSVTNMYGDNWRWWRRVKNVYQNKSYSLKIGNIDLLNKVCDKLDSIGYNDYYLGKIDYSKSDELKKEIQQQAVKQARAKAENLLAGEGKTIGELISVQEQTAAKNNYPYYNYDDSYANREMAADKAYEPPVNFKKIKMTYNIIVRYSIK